MCNDASRAVGVASGADVGARQRAEYVDERARRIRADRRSATRARRPTSSACRSPRRAPTRSRSTGRATCRRSRRFLGTRRFRRLSDRRARRLHRLDAVLPDLGAEGHAIRRSSTTRRSARRRARCSTTRRRCCARSSTRTGSRAKRASSASGRPMPSATTSSSTPTNRAASRSRRCYTLRQQIAQARRPRQRRRSPISSRRANGHRRLCRRLRGHRRHRRGRRSPNASSAPTTTTPRSWSRRSPTAWPKPSPSACTSACARSSGAMRRTRRSATSELIARELSRHPPGARLSGAARPHREGDAVRAARRARRDRHQAHRELRDVAGRVGLRALFHPSGERTISASARSSATRSRTTPRRKGWTRRRGRALAGADPQLRSQAGRRAGRSRLIGACQKFCFENEEGTGAISDASFRCLFMFVIASTSSPGKLKRTQQNSSDE